MELAATSKTVVLKVDDTENSEKQKSEAEKQKHGRNAPNGKNKQKKVRYKDMTPEQKKKKHKRDWIITGSVFLFIGVLIAIFALTGFLGAKANTKMINSLDTVGCALTPVIDEKTGYYTFTTDGDFKVLQLTDVHIGAGAFSIKKDNWALNAVAALIKHVKPDLVVVSGDIAYPVPFQAGTFDNKREAIMFASLMEKLGVYWAPVFGNHDTEAYSMYDREDIGEIYASGDYKYCLFQTGPSKEVDGVGNYIINVKNSLGLITQSIVLLDSHSYTDGDIFGIYWKYDNLHQNQIDWYANQINALNQDNIARFNALTRQQQDSYASSLGISAADFSSSVLKSSMFFHIPLTEYRDAWTEYVDNNYQSTANIRFKFGVMGETGKMIYSGIGDDNMFETILSLGSTQGVFCGHDHYNNFSLDYNGGSGDKYVRLTYGMSIDYLAYMGIAKKTEQRGGTIITYSQTGAMNIEQCRLSDID